MSYTSLSRFKALISTFYGHLLNASSPRKADLERMPMTIIGDFRDKTLVKTPPQAKVQEKSIVRIDRFLSEEEQCFMQELKAEFQLSEDDLLIFNLVAYARHDCLHGVEKTVQPCFDEAVKPDFSPRFLSMLMESIKPNLTFSRGYYAAMVYLKNHPVPAAWEPA